MTIIGALGNDEQSQCIWRGVCYRFPADVDESEDLYNCPYNGPPLPLEKNESKTALLALCPEIFKDRKLADI